VLCFNAELLTEKELLERYSEKKHLIKQRLREFSEKRNANNEELFEELCYCILTANASARMGIRCIQAIREELRSGCDQARLEKLLRGRHRYPRKRAEYIARAKKYLEEEHRFNLKEMLNNHEDIHSLRDYLAKNITGLGYKEASHYLRNIGFTGLAILDKHVLNSLRELGVIREEKPPRNRQEYLELEAEMKRFSEGIRIPLDELDLLLWSEKTGEVLK